MGEVYRALDTNLKRSVAIKVLPDAFASDSERLGRFQREAEILASLNHPNIAALYDLERANSTTALVMELVDGPPLSVRLALGPISVGEALLIARQIALALEAAHEQHIIHRDLKPANVSVSSKGLVKVLDFGLAKALEPPVVIAAPMASPTMTSPAATRAGIILGTAAYMSPEQAKGRTADKRSDVWAFGCVLYEMLTGRAPFAGETVSEVLGEILKSEPDWHRLPPDTPDGIRRLLRRCLQKDPFERLHDIADARLEIDDAGRQTREPTQAASSRGRLGLIVALALVTLVVGAQTVRLWRAARSGPAAPQMRLDITTPSSSGTRAAGELESLAISPDGQKVAFVTVSDSQSQLWLRPIDSASARPVPGTEMAVLPFWSPDSRSVGFFANNELKRIDIEGGSIKTLARAPYGRGGAWNRDGTILFAPIFTGPIYRIPDSGGEAVPVTRLAPGQATHDHPRFLEDGRRFLYHASGSSDGGGVFVGDLNGAPPRRVLDAELALVHPSSRQLLFIRQGTLYSQALDSTGTVVVGNPSAMAERVVTVSASDAGLIAYRTVSDSERRQLVWLDRNGQEIGRVGRPEYSRDAAPSLSPDGRYIAQESDRGGDRDISLLELARGVSRPLTSDPGWDLAPEWSPDGRRLVFASTRSGVYDLYQQSTTNPEGAELLLATPQNKSPTDWSRDGRFILFRNVDPVTSHDLWALPLDGTKAPFPVVRTQFTESYGQFSPDGNWIAYQSDESGRVEIYVQPFPGPGTKVTISTSGGAQMRWSPDGKELFYVALDGRLMAVPIRRNSQGTAVAPGQPVPLFDANVGLVVPLQSGHQEAWTISRDGKKFLMNTIVERASAPPITLILNWRPNSNEPTQR
jgi:serine/threonine protein kinase